MTAVNNGKKKSYDLLLHIANEDLPDQVPGGFSLLFSIMSGLNKQWGENKKLSHPNILPSPLSLQLNLFPLFILFLIFFPFP